MHRTTQAPLKNEMVQTIPSLSRTSSPPKPGQASAMAKWNRKSPNNTCVFLKSAGSVPDGTNADSRNAKNTKRSHRAQQRMDHQSHQGVAPHGGRQASTRQTGFIMASHLLHCLLAFQSRSMMQRWIH